ncbi:hypothetical protein TRVL_09297 [Trypanosoma vivax]|nr:hypothetical protein TRVL_09297 [Trypanosoma vivax]
MLSNYIPSLRIWQQVEMPGNVLSQSSGFTTGAKVTEKVPDPLLWQECRPIIAIICGLRLLPLHVTNRTRARVALKSTEEVPRKSTVRCDGRMAKSSSKNCMVWAFIGVRYGLKDRRTSSPYTLPHMVCV